MKKLIALLTAAILLLTVATAAAGSKVPIDFGSMTEEELLELAGDLAGALEGKGYKLSVENEKSGQPKTGEDEPAPEPAAEASDENFVNDLAAGLCRRWDYNDQDSSLMSDAEYVVYAEGLVNCELQILEKYADYFFEDVKLGGYAQGYMEALKAQMDAVKECYLQDENRFKEQWRNALKDRARYIYLINKAYGLSVPSRYNASLREMVARGNFYNQSTAIEEALRKELAKAEPEFRAEGSTRYINLMPFNLTNTSGFDISELSIYIYLYRGDVVGWKDCLVSYTDVKAGQAVSTAKDSTREHFTGIAYSYSFKVDTGTYSETVKGEVEPKNQYGWDGYVVTKNGETAEGQPEFMVENVSAAWVYRSSFSGKYVPSVEFDVRNTGTGNAEKIDIRCVFTTAGNKAVWDEVTTDGIRSSDSALKPGFSKQVTVYSSEGYLKQPEDTPEITIEIYINNRLMDTIILEAYTGETMDNG